MHASAIALALSLLVGLTSTQPAPGQCSIQYTDYRNAKLTFEAKNHRLSWPVHGFPWCLVKESDPNLHNYVFSDDATDPMVQELILYLYSEPIAMLTLYDSCVVISVSASEILGDEVYMINPAQEAYVKRRLQEITYRVIAVVEAHYNIKCDVVETDAPNPFAVQSQPPSPMLP